MMTCDDATLDVAQAPASGLRPCRRIAASSSPASGQTLFWKATIGTPSTPRRPLEGPVEPLKGQTVTRVHPAHFKPLEARSEPLRASE